MTGDLSIRVEDLGHGFRLVCSGEIDISNVEELRSAIDLCLGYRPLFLQIDFRNMTFVSWAAVEALVYAKGRCRDLGVRWSLPENLHVRRLLHAVGCSSIDQLEWQGRGGARGSEDRRVV
jgi:anti-anti-sigma regulatory factor